METPNATVLTLGHSSHPLEHFVALLQRHDAELVADVRSIPYSRRHPAYNRESLERSLPEQRIGYRFLGRELGAKSPDPACIVDGRVDYRRIAASSAFQAGLAAVITTARTLRVVLLCAEQEPLACHRTLLVARELVARGVAVAHIHADGHLEPHAELLGRLRRLVGVPEQDLVRSEEELLAEAYARQERRIAVVVEPRAGAARGAAR